METYTELIFLFYFICFIICTALIALLHILIKNNKKTDNSSYEDSFIRRI